MHGMHVKESGAHVEGVREWQGSSAQRRHSMACPCMLHSYSRRACAACSGVDAFTPSPSAICTPHAAKFIVRTSGLQLGALR